MRRYTPLVLLALCFAGPTRAADPDPEFAKLVPAAAKVEKLAGGLTITLLAATLLHSAAKDLTLTLLVYNHAQVK